MSHKKTSFQSETDPWITKTIFIMGRIAKRQAQDKQVYANLLFNRILHKTTEVK